MYHSLWQDKPFARGQAWFDLLLLANYAPQSIWLKGQEVKVKRGQLAWSEVSLSERWGWSRNKIRSFLKWLEKERQIEQQKNNVTTVITIINYEKYQSDGTADETPEGTAEKHQKNIGLNTDKEVKKEKKQKEETLKPLLALSDENQSLNAETANVCISLPLNDKSVFPVTEQQAADWQGLYPGVDVQQALRSMKGWLQSEPTRLKTRRGILKFITGWLAREQDRGGRPVQGGTKTQPPNKGVIPPNPPEIDWLGGSSFDYQQE